MSFVGRNKSVKYPWFNVKRSDLIHIQSSLRATVKRRSSRLMKQNKVGFSLASLLQYVIAVMGGRSRPLPFCLVKLQKIEFGFHDATTRINCYKCL